MSGSFLRQAFTESVSAVTATKPAGLDLGTIRYEGGLKYIYVYNAGTTQISPTFAAHLQTGASDYTVTITHTAKTPGFIGVVKHTTLTTATYGWVVCQGRVTAAMSGTISGACSLLYSEDDGYIGGANAATYATALNDMYGYAYSTATDTSILVYVNSNWA
jgi:hypothetical protein